MSTSSIIQPFYQAKATIFLNALFPQNVSNIHWGSEIWTFEILTFWSSEFNFVHKPLVHMMKKVLFYSFLNVLHMRSLVEIHNIGLPDFRSHLKSGPSATQPLFNHSKSRLFQISDSQCKTIYTEYNNSVLLQYYK